VNTQIVKQIKINEDDIKELEKELNDACNTRIN